MSISKNSLSTLLNDLVRIQMNASEIVNELSKAVSSNSDTVELDLMDGNNAVRKVTIPSYSGLKSQIERLDESLKSMSGLGGSNSTIKLSDGSFRKVIANSLKKEAKNISSIGYPTTFESRENWFFEQFLSPLLYVSFNFQGQIKPNTQRVEMARYLLKLDSNQKLDYFNNFIKGNTSISSDRLLSDLGSQNIEFNLDRDYIDLPPRSLRYYGNFSVQRVFEETKDVTVDGEVVKKKELKFRLNKLTYNDSESNFPDTQQVKVGDFLVINGDNQSTRYRIDSIQSSTKTIGVKKIEGFTEVGVGNNNLAFYSSDEDIVNNVNVGVSLSEYSVVFIRPIDPDSNIGSPDWSPGVGFYTNELTIQREDGTQQSLISYYQEEVADFGQFLLSGSQENIKPSSLAEIPEVPTLNESNFNVLQINRHATDSPIIDDIKKLHQDKQTVDSQIKQLETSIKDLRLKINTVKYTSQIQKDSDKNALNALVNEKDSNSKLYASIISDINTKSTSEAAQSARPKFRLRGFWPFPKPKSNDATGDQDVVQFEVRYRYVTIGGGANSPEQIEFIDTDGTTRRGTVSPWIKIKTNVRERELKTIKSPITRIIDGKPKVIPQTKTKWNWKIEDIEDADTPNINMLDLPIREGEGIEFQIKSISEAGWPANPAISDWTETVRVDFPDNLSSQFAVDGILEEAKKEQVRVDLLEELNTKGLDTHLSSSFIANEKYFAHSALELASGFVSSEQTPISIFEKLNQIDSELGRLKDLIERAKGSLVVKIVDQDGEELTVENSSVVELDAGNYVDEVSSLQIKKGVIVTKTYYIKIENEAASDLELWSRFFGSQDQFLPDSYSGGSTYESTAEEYNTELRYDAVPITTVKPDKIDLLKNHINQPPFASKQLRGQFINSRYTSIEGTSTGLQPLYNSINSSGLLTDPVNNSIVSSLDNLEYFPDLVNSVVGLNTNNANLGAGYLWNMEPSVNSLPPQSPGNTIDEQTIPSDYDNQVYIHIDHPDITNASATQSFWKLESRISKLANLQVSDSNSLLQSAYYFDSTSQTTNRTSFKPDDQYLLGGRSCGSYLFLAPTKHELIRVKGSKKKNIELVEFGPNKAISIPVIFQYRMTDYAGTNDTGLGFVGGQAKNPINQMQFTKRLGIDLFYDQSNTFNFDIEISAKYRSTTFKYKDIPNKTIQNTINDLTKATKNTNPNIL